MGEFVSKNLASGKATNVKTTIYTVPAGRSAIVRSITLTNTDLVNPVTIELTANFGAGSVYCAPKNLTLAAKYFFEHDISITMGSGNMLEISASPTNVVDYIVSGVEEV